MEELVGQRSPAPLPRPSFWEGRRVLLTGHTGFKGSWLAVWLSKLGAEVHGLSLEPDTTPNLWHDLNLPSSLLLRGQKLLTHHIGDLRNPDVAAAAVNAIQPQVVLHLAAQSLVRRSYADPLGTWSTNVLGTLHLLEAMRGLEQPCAAVMITTDKVYRNHDCQHSFREDDPLGGHDPYSSSKAAAELAIASWRSSFCGAAAHQTPWLALASVRAGNVIGGGDWSTDRLVPDLIRSLHGNEPLQLRSPESTRPWQHVLEPACAYLVLAEQLYQNHDPKTPEHNPFATAFNIGPSQDSNRSVGELLAIAYHYWPKTSPAITMAKAPNLVCDRGAELHEAKLLNLCTDLADQRLGWQPRWNFETSIAKTIDWYSGQLLNGETALNLCEQQIAAYNA